MIPIQDEIHNRQYSAINYVLIILAILGFILMFLILRDSLTLLAQTYFARIVIKVATVLLPIVQN
jgi:hypothetical protein